MSEIPEVSPSSLPGLASGAGAVPADAGPHDPVKLLDELAERVGTEVVGYAWMVRMLFISLLIEGHVLLEGTPGVAKTLLVRRFASSLALGFKRIQFTPDMLPSDIIGNVVLEPADHTFQYRRGPVFTNVVLADEINRAPPKVQSALLEAMQERQVTVDGSTYPLPRPFLVIATQNPADQEGTYPLPEAQLDRLTFRLLVDYPSEADEEKILRRHLVPVPTETPRPIADGHVIAEHRRRAEAVFVHDDIVSYIARLVRATRDDPRILVGGSPRCGVQLGRAAMVHAMLNGRSYVAPEDVRDLAFWVLNHRVVLHPDLDDEAYGSETRADAPVRMVLGELFDRVPAPR